MVRYAFASRPTNFGYQQMVQERRMGQSEAVAHRFIGFESLETMGLAAPSYADLRTDRRGSPSALKPRRKLAINIYPCLFP